MFMIFTFQNLQDIQFIYMIILIDYLQIISDNTTQKNL